MTVTCRIVFRARATVLPQEVHALINLVVGPPWTTTNDGRQLILADDGGADKILVLCTTENLRRFVKSSRTLQCIDVFLQRQTGDVNVRRSNPSVV